MASKKEIILPKLPKGMGSYGWKDKNHTIIRFRKQITYKEVTENLSASGASIKEVNEAMRIKEEEFRTRVDLQLTKVKTGTLEANMNDWLQLYKQDDLKNKSYDRVESTYLTHIVGSELGRMQEQAITSDHIQSHMKNLRNVKTGEKLAYSSVKKVYELLNQYFRYKFIKQPYLNPMLVVTKPKKDEQEEQQSTEELIIWDDEEMLKLSKVAAAPYINGISGYKHGLAIVFMMWSFMRCGEALALRWSDIDFENETVDIHHQVSRVKDRECPTNGTKKIMTSVKYHSARKYKVPKMAIDAIKEYKNRKGVTNDDEFVFSTIPGNTDDLDSILSETGMTTTYHAMIKKAGLNPDKNVTIHGLRHSGISYLLRHGVPVEVVSKNAGHKSIKVTLEIYYSVIEQQKNEAIDKFNQEHYVDFLGAGSSKSKCIEGVRKEVQ